MPPRHPKPKDTPAKLASRMKRRWRIVLMRKTGQVLGTVEATDAQAAEKVVLQNRIGYLLKRPVGRPPNDVRRYYANFTYKAASWTKPRRLRSSWCGMVSPSRRSYAVTPDPPVVMGARQEGLDSLSHPMSANRSTGALKTGVVSMSMPNDAKQAPWDEIQFERELAFEEKRARREARWKMFNQPFVLWAMSTVAVGILTFTFANYTACRTSLNADRELLSKIIRELSYRERKINALFPQPLDSPDAIKKARSVVDPNIHSLFAEFKGVRTRELAWRLDNISDKWNLENETNVYSDTSIVPIERIKAMASALDTVEFMTSMYGDTPKPLFVPNEAVALSQAISALSKNLGMGSGYWKSGWVSPPVCLYRAIWPR